MIKVHFALIAFLSLLLSPVSSFAEEVQKSIDASAMAPAALNAASIQNIRQDMGDFQRVLENEFGKAKVQYILNQALEKPPALNLTEEPGE